MINSGGIWEALSQEVFSDGRDGEKYDTRTHSCTLTLKHRHCYSCPTSQPTVLGLGAASPSIATTVCVIYPTHNTPLQLAS